jgi:hypothetical protein
VFLLTIYFVTYFFTPRFVYLLVILVKLKIIDILGNSSLINLYYFFFHLLEKGGSSVQEN